MSEFALPTDPDAKKRKKEQAKEEAKKPKVPPEQESVHRCIFATVLYVCLLALTLLLIPAVGSTFNTKSAIPGPEDAGPTIGRLWTMVDQIAVVRRYPREDNLLKAFVFNGLGPLWFLCLLPPLVIVGVQYFVKDKELACRLHYLLALGMTLGMIGVGALSIAEVVANRPGG